VETQAHRSQDFAKLELHVGSIQKCKVIFARLLSEQQIANAIAMAAVSDASFAVVRAKPLSQWKGLASAQSAVGSMNALFLARRGVEGPLRGII
jgi:2-methylcitrate dehydratase PrpD